MGAGLPPVSFQWSNEANEHQEIPVIRDHAMTVYPLMGKVVPEQC